MLVLRDICKTFYPGTPDEKAALSHISLTVNDGDFVSVIGSNGAGKSTLFNAIAGSFFTDSGSIVLDGKNITVMPEHKRSKFIGRMFQDPMKGTAPGMTVEENLALAAGRGSWLSLPTEKDKRLYRERIAMLEMGLEDKMNKPVGQLSGGQRQALTLMMATFNPPSVLLLDEHTAALDPATADKVLSLTKKIVSENRLTCLMITHNMQSALDLGNRTIMMNNGKIIMDICGEERSNATVNDLLRAFRSLAGENLTNDRMLLV